MGLEANMLHTSLFFRKLNIQEDKHQHKLERNSHTKYKQMDHMMNV